MALSLERPSLPMFADAALLSSMASLMPSVSAVPGLRSGPHPYQTSQTGATIRHSRYRGVTWDKRDQRWRVRINCLGVQHHVGRYTQELQAARVYDRVSYLLYGEDAITNFGIASAAADNCSIPRTMLQLKERYQQWKAQQQELQPPQQPHIGSPAMPAAAAAVVAANMARMTAAAGVMPQAQGPLGMAGLGMGGALSPLDLLHATAHLNTALSLAGGAPWPPGSLAATSGPAALPLQQLAPGMPDLVTTGCLPNPSNLPATYPAVSCDPVAGLLSSAPPMSGVLLGSLSPAGMGGGAVPCHPYGGGVLDANALAATLAQATLA